MPREGIAVGDVDVTAIDRQFRTHSQVLRPGPSSLGAFLEPCRSLLASLQALLQFQEPRLSRVPSDHMQETH